MTGITGEDSDIPFVKRGADLADLQNEIAGHDTGRPLRFLSSEGRAEMTPEGPRRRRDAYSRLAAMLMADAEYAALFEDVWNTLGTAEIATNQALADLNEEIDAIAAELTELEDQASTLPDGTMVFRSADGRVLTEHGRELTPDEVPDVAWQEGAPAWEAYLAKKQHMQNLSSDRDDILRYQRDVLDPAHQRLSDGDNPLSKDELRQIQKDIEEQAPTVLRSETAMKPATGTVQHMASRDTPIPQI